MQDMIPKGTGNSRFLKSAIPADITHEQLVALFRSGQFPVDFAGLNPEGIATQGTPLNTMNLLSNETADALKLAETARTVDTALRSVGGIFPGDVIHTWRIVEQNLSELLARGIVPNNVANIAASIKAPASPTEKYVPAHQYCAKLDNYYRFFTQYNAYYAADVLGAYTAIPVGQLTGHTPSSSDGTNSFAGWFYVAGKYIAINKQLYSTYYINRVGYCDTINGTYTFGTLKTTCNASLLLEFKDRIIWIDGANTCWSLPETPFINNKVTDALNTFNALIASATDDICAYPSSYNAANKLITMCYTYDGLIWQSATLPTMPINPLTTTNATLLSVKYVPTLNKWVVLMSVTNGSVSSGGGVVMYIYMADDLFSTEWQDLSCAIYPDNTRFSAVTVNAESFVVMGNTMTILATATIKEKTTTACFLQYRYMTETGSWQYVGEGTVFTLASAVLQTVDDTSLLYCTYADNGVSLSSQLCLLDSASASKSIPPTSFIKEGT